jgi:predicted GH43/DUF377 family glycosyl hydrolase
MFVVRRSPHNPILSPDSESYRESFSVFNGSPVPTKDGVSLVYRAVSKPEKFENHSFTMSTIGIADSKDGVSFKKRREFIVPEAEWERYGCEDPRVTKLGNKYYIFYTALSTFPFTPQGIKAAVAISDDLETISERHLVTPFNTKAVALLPEKINGQYVAVLTAFTDEPPLFGTIAIAAFDKIEDMWSEAYWKEWLAHINDHQIPLYRDGKERMEVGAAPVKTKDGWLLIYSRIQNHNATPIFGIEAALLDLKNPQKVIAETKGPIMVPEESYEKYGILPNIIFPSGCYEDEGILKIYYGGCDTVCATAEVRIDDLVNSMVPNKQIVTRAKKNPILAPRDLAWEKNGVFNPAAIDLDGKMHILYRAMSDDNTSTVGYATSKDGIKIDSRSDWPIYKPRVPSEAKGVLPSGNSGCEDPRITKIGDKLFMCYTAYNGLEPPAVALTSITVDDFLKNNWTAWEKPTLISPTGQDDKDACVFPVGNKGKYKLIHRLDGTLCMSDINILRPKPVTEHAIIMRPRPGMWDGKKIGLASPPHLTKAGWLMFYHGVSDDSVYRVGVALLDSKDPQKVIARSTGFIFEPVEDYEKYGIVNNVVFPCGTAIRDNTIFIYYGGADKVLGVATVELDALLELLAFGETG